MGSPLGPILANIFLSRHEEKWLNKYPIEFKLSFYRRYVNDVFVLFILPESAPSFCEYKFSKHQNINFPVEHENIGSLSFLDVNICRKNCKFLTRIHKKPTFSGAFISCKSFVPTYQKGNFYKHYLKGVSVYVVISRHFTLNTI